MTGKATADRRLAVTFGVPGKAEQRREVRVMRIIEWLAIGGAGQIEQHIADRGRISHIEEVSRPRRAEESAYTIVWLQDETVAQVKWSLVLPPHTVLQREVGPKLPVILERK